MLHQQVRGLQGGRDAQIAGATSLQRVAEELLAQAEAADRVDPGAKAARADLPAPDLTGAIDVHPHEPSEYTAYTDC